MHLTEDGFIALIDPKLEWVTVGYFGDKPWFILWQEFLSEASRFDGRKLTQLFGNTDPIHPPPLDPQKMTERDRILIGEFIRRHHATLAHQIALNGVPGPTRKRIQLKETEPDLADLAGLIARSHGLPVRATLPYLSERYDDPRAHQGIHSVFLMALLRVSDYFQIESERAPEQFLRVRRLRSPVSQREWTAHNAIEDIRHTHEDPESVFIRVAPDSILTLLRVKEWLAGIQLELDSSWAVLGEIYGRYPGLNQLGFVVRRVRSNLENAGFLASLPFIPRKASFNTADADLLKLLIEPLYGKHPEIGIRELIQNATDAVRELHEYLRQRSDIKHLDQLQQEADVAVSLDKDEHGVHWVTVSDRGIGMTSEIICQYFLTAGASFRKSDAWRQRFEDATGKSRILRSGRFGVGALASFLLGDEVQVATRHVDAPASDGVEFVASIDSEAIELRRVKLPVGTTVRVKITEEVAKHLEEAEGWRAKKHEKWDWYCLATPTVLRRGYGQSLKQKYVLPTPGVQLPPNWRKLLHPEFSEVQWTYADAPELVCNGIIVGSEGVRPYGSEDTNVIDIDNTYRALKEPKLSIFDPDGNLPLNLQRTGLATIPRSLGGALRSAIVEDAIAFALSSGPQRPIQSSASYVSYGAFNHPGIAPYASYHITIAPWFSTPAGFSLLDDWCIRSSGVSAVSFLATYTHAEQVMPSLRPNLPHARLHTRLSPSIAVLDEWLRFALAGQLLRTYQTGNRKHEPFASLSVVGRRVLISRFDAERAENKLPKYIMNSIHTEWRSRKWDLWKTGDCPDAITPFRKFAQFEQGNWAGQVVEWYIGKRAENQEISPVAQVWKDILGTALIPFALPERKKQFAAAIVKLKPYILAWQADAKFPKSEWGRNWF
jgi:hypothetical protein